MNGSRGIQVTCQQVYSGSRGIQVTCQRCSAAHMTRCSASQDSGCLLCYRKKPYRPLATVSACLIRQAASMSADARINLPAITEAALLSSSHCLCCLPCYTALQAALMAAAAQLKLTTNAIVPVHLPASAASADVPPCRLLSCPRVRG
jgi:hypothetical protein